MGKIKLDLVSDIVCPWCIVGYKNLTKAINELGLQEQVELEWQPFELNSNMPPEGENLREHIMRKYGSTREQSDQARANLRAKGQEIGFTFNFSDDSKMVNTFDAHILLDFAKEHGKQTDLKLALFAAYFTDQQDVSNHQVLAAIVAGVGLDADQAMARLSQPEYRQHTRQQIQYWQGLGVSSVPTVVFNRSSAMNGAHPVESFKQVLSELVAKVD
ncbi:DsbA family oxidoreductase [Shewanella aestuarii]|uniref:DsbA family oxidoreductase n=1 Tax=Shewanella aestuarii TaxID=1028752 RepID=A0A6G9QNE5_9GAMM|nr:DsbA family oxidoreductase [Shewanella aestuarii]QIR15928.1 DsbA family oxidoreductase [Shewanella aestuarii]